MKTLKKVPVKFAFTKGEESLPTFEKMEEGIIYISIEYGCSQHKCLCGCGEIATMSLKPTWENGWDLIENSKDIYSFTPSIGNYNFHCKSHYIITKNIANFV